MQEIVWADHNKSKADKNGKQKLPKLIQGRVCTRPVGCDWAINKAACTPFIFKTNSQPDFCADVACIKGMQLCSAMPESIFGLSLANAGKVTKLGRSFARSRDYDAMGKPLGPKLQTHACNCCSLPRHMLGFTVPLPWTGFWRNL